MIFVRKHYLGIDLGDDAVRGVLLRKKTRGWRVEAVFHHEVTGENEEGRAASQQEGLRRIARSTQLRAPITTMGMPTSASALKVVDLPATDRRALEQILQFEADQHLPFTADTAEVDFDLIGRPREDVQRVALAGGSKGALNSYRSALHAGGLRPRFIDVGLLGAATCFAGRPASGDVSEPDGVLVVDVGAKRSAATVLVHGTFHSCRLLPVGGEGLTEALAADFDLPSPDAQQVKRRHGVQPPIEYAADNQTPGLTEWLARLTAELKAMMQAYRAESRTGQIVRLLLAGEGALIPGLAEALARRLRVEAFAPNPWAAFETGDGIDASLEAAAPFAAATGFALRPDRPLIAINLGRQLARQAVAARQGRLRLSGVVALFLVVGALGGMRFHQQLLERRNELVTLKEQCLRLHAQVTPPDPHQRNITELARRVAAARYDGRLWLELLRRLSLDLPEGVWLEELHCDAQGTLTLRGAARSSAQVANAVSILRRLPGLADVRLTFANLVTRGKVQVVQFQTTCTVIMQEGIRS